MQNALLRIFIHYDSKSMVIISIKFYKPSQTIYNKYILIISLYNLYTNLWSC